MKTPMTRSQKAKGSVTRHNQRRKAKQPVIVTEDSSEQETPVVRYSVETGIKQIENEQLTGADVPGKRTSWKTVCRFAYSFDGYDHGHSTSECGDIGNGLREQYIANCFISAPLSDLRIALFFEARRYHHFGTDPDADAMRYLRVVVDEIRKQVTEIKKQK